jgi:regulator of replication initiation timing
MVTEESEYELVPMSPIRRLEQRLDRIESSSPIDSKNIFSDVIDIVRMNQQLVDELAKSNDAMRIELSKLPAKLDELIVNLKELITFVRASGETESVGITQDTMKPVVDKLDEMVKTNKVISEKNDSMLELLDEMSKKMRRPQLMRPMQQMQSGPVNQPLRPQLRPINV